MLLFLRTFRLYPAELLFPQKARDSPDRCPVGITPPPPSAQIKQVLDGGAALDMTIPGAMQHSRCSEVDIRHSLCVSSLLHRPAALAGSPVISDISLVRLSPAAVPAGDSPFSPPHPYVSPHMEHYLRSVHGSPTLSMISAARGLSPAERKSGVCCGI